VSNAHERDLVRGRFIAQDAEAQGTIAQDAEAQGLCARPFKSAEETLTAAKDSIGLV